jgi:hypothetical protein
MANFVVTHNEVRASSADEHEQLGTCFSFIAKYPILILETAERNTQLGSS